MTPTGATKPESSIPRPCNGSHISPMCEASLPVHGPDGQSCQRHITCRCKKAECCARSRQICTGLQHDKISDSRSEPSEFQCFLASFIACVSTAVTRLEHFDSASSSAGTRQHLLSVWNLLITASKAHHRVGWLLPNILNADHATLSSSHHTAL